MQPFKDSVVAALRAWALCILLAPSCNGKSTLAKSLHDIFGWGSPFIQTVQDEPFADLRGFETAIVMGTSCSTTSTGSNFFTPRCG